MGSSCSKLAGVGAAVLALQDSQHRKSHQDNPLLPLCSGDFFTVVHGLIGFVWVFFVRKPELQKSLKGPGIKSGPF